MSDLREKLTALVEEWERRAVDFKAWRSTANFAAADELNRCARRLRSLLDAETAREAETVDPLVTVCSACLRASCWNGVFYCDNAQRAGTLDLPRSMLARLGREHASYYAAAPVPAEPAPTAEDLDADEPMPIPCTCPEGFHTPGEGCEADE